MTTEQTKPPVSLSNLLLPNKVVTFDFPDFDGMTVDLCYMSRDEKSKLYKKCVTNSFDRASGRLIEKLDDDLFIKAFSKATVKGWSGFKYRYLEELLLVDIKDLDPDDTLQYTTDNAEQLLRGSDTFDSWVTAQVAELENFSSNK